MAIKIMSQERAEELAILASKISEEQFIAQVKELDAKKQIGTLNGMCDALHTLEYPAPQIVSTILYQQSQRVKDFGDKAYGLSDKQIILVVHEMHFVLSNIGKQLRGINILS